MRYARSVVLSRWLRPRRAVLRAALSPVPPRTPPLRLAVLERYADEEADVTPREWYDEARRIRAFLREVEHETRYNVLDGVASRQSETANMRAARLGATPPGRAARHSGVDE